MPSGKYIKTELHKLHISNALTGRKLSPEHARKMGATKIGNKNMLGKHHTVSSKRALSIAHKGKKLTEEHRKKIGLSLLGRPSTMRNKTHNINTKRKMSFSRRRERHWNWQGGKSDIKKAIRNMFEYRQWLSDVFKRDGFVCQRCWKKGGRLNAHHINAFSSILEENKISTIEMARECSELWNINNGITLCLDCHKDTDSYKNRKK